MPCASRHDQRFLGAPRVPLTNAILQPPSNSRRFRSLAVNLNSENDLDFPPVDNFPPLVSNWYQRSSTASIRDEFLSSSSLLATYRSFSTAHSLPFLVLPYYHFSGASYFVLGTFPL